MDGSSHDRDRAQVWQTESLPGLTMIRGRYVTQRFPRHVHEEYVIGVNAGGAHRFYCRGGVHPVGQGAIALVNPGDVHTGEPLGAEAWNYRGFYPTGRLLLELWQEATGRGAPSAPRFERPVVEDRQLATRLLRASRASRGRDPLRSSSDVIEALTRLMIRHAGAIAVSRTERTPESTAARAREYIHAHATRAMTLQDLADATGCGRYGVLRAFRRAYGLAPYEYVVALRVGHAKRLLAAGHAIAATAYACGFTDQSHLNRHFRRLVGVTPGAFAGAHRRG